MAEVRSVAMTPIPFQESDIAEHGDIRAGDVVLAFLSGGGPGQLSQMRISGGSGTWARLRQLPGGGTDYAGSVLMGKVATADETSTDYTASFGAGNLAGVATVLVVRAATLSGIVIETSSDDDAIAPAATPSSAAGMEIRYGVSFALEPIAWRQLPGYDGADIQADTFVSAAIAVKQFWSSAAVPALDMQPTPSTYDEHAFTVLLKAAGSGGGQAPDPPTFPASTPGKGESHVRVTIHDARTGDYIDDIAPSGLVLSKYASEPGSWRGRLDLAERREAARINAIFPADPADLTSGPGRLVAHTWLSGVLWGVHWLHTTETAQDSRGNVYMQVVGSTLDAYLLSVALEEEIAYGDDQIANARDLITHMQATPGSNIGLGLMSGLSGVVRPLTGKPGPGVTYGRILQDYARQHDGFEHVVNARVVDGSIIRSWEWGAPKLVGSGVHSFEQGEDGGTITGWREVRSALSGGTRWGAWGGTPEQEDATEPSEPIRGALVTTPHVAAGWPIIDQRPAHPGNSTIQSEIDNYAIYWANTAPGAPSVFTFDAVIGPGSTLGPNSIGDTVRAVLDNPRYPIRADGSASFDRSQRLLGWELTVADRDQAGKDRIKLVTESEVAGP
ncbi:hypothetical protein [Nonomuraea bangladeshensis]|uniref:hypothetical protein n=1 Tax=Nonomuraea bangladeshensis TaxID=404385 RepID=UPI003C2B2324